MIAQWDSSLSVLAELRAMIAQWDSSPSVLPVAMIAQWDSSPSVLPVAMIAQWDSSLSVLPEVWVQFPTMTEYFKELFRGSSHLPWTQFGEYRRAEWRPLGKKAFSLMKIMACLQISLR